MSDDKDPMTPADFRDLFPTARPARLQQVINERDARIRLLEQQLSTAREEERERCAKLIDELEVRFHELTNEALSLKQDNRASRCGSVAHEMNRAARAIRSLGEK